MSCASWYSQWFDTPFQPLLAPFSDHLYASGFHVEKD